MGYYNIIVLISTAILIATVVTIIFAIAVYIISRRRRRKIREERVTETIIVKEGAPEEMPKTPEVADGPKILKLYDPYKKEENRKNGSKER